jgi:LysR family transcriptional regulator, regulator for bpeEF and oprC
VDTASRQWNNRTVLDLNDVRVFEKVAAASSFAAAARALGLPKSTVSRSIARLEEELGARLFQRTTREVVLTPTGQELKERCSGILGRLEQAVNEVRSSKSPPRGILRVSAAIGFGINVLADELPEFLNRFPGLKLSIDLSTRTADLVAEGIDVAIRLGPMPSSGLVSARLGSMTRHLCVAPSYIKRRGKPESLDDLVEHDTIEAPDVDGRPRCWTFTKDGETRELVIVPRVSVNEALTIRKLVLNGTGIGVISGYLCAPEFAARRLVPLFGEWSLPPVEVSIVFASKRELDPNVREFVNFMKEVTTPGRSWLNEPSWHAADPGDTAPT